MIYVSISFLLSAADQHKAASTFIICLLHFQFNMEMEKSIYYL